jgi:c-di-GMP-related signal transduction protein
MAIARQAILNAKREVFGYELFDRSVKIDEHTAASDAQMLFNVLSLTDNQALAGQKAIFVNCTHESLSAGHLDLVELPSIVLELPALPASKLDQIEDYVPRLQEMQRRGFRLAFDQSILMSPYACWLPLASFIKIDLSTVGERALEALVRRAQNQSKAVLIAEKVESSVQYAQASALGVSLFQGYWFARPVLVQGHTVRPAQAAILQLINLVRKQASTNEIEEIFKREPTLSFNLLRFINSAGFGMRTEITSFKHAVMLLGLKRLFKWAALLMTTSRAGDLPPAVGSTAVVRGRLMELLALHILPAEDCDNAFVVGVFSLLDTMLGISMPNALATLALPSSINDALLTRTGPFAPFLDLTIACETGDDNAFARSAIALGLDSNQVNMAHLEALTWAESFTD